MRGSVKIQPHVRFRSVSAIGFYGCLYFMFESLRSRLRSSVVELCCVES